MLPQSFCSSPLRGFLRAFAAPSALLLSLLIASRARATPIPTFAPADNQEQSRLTTEDAGVRLYLNAAADFDSTRPTLLLFFATPNGNTLEQTLGAKPVAGQTLDWHFDIQHVAAQTRKFRTVDPSRNIVLAVVQTKELSWPTFRSAHADNPRRIISIVQTARDALPKDNRVSFALSAHSGGGAFLFGYINAADAIPASVERIAFLDANHSYNDDPDHHGGKLFAWLNADAARHLVVIAYDDREIVLNGKKVVSATGGSFRASHRMIDFFQKQSAFTADKRGPFDHQSALGGKIQLFIHPNPDNKILHTALVGEMNGLLQAMTIGTSAESKWGIFGGPRAYTDFIPTAPPGPATAPATSAAASFPPRPSDALSGSAFAATIAGLPPPEREQPIFDALSRGNLPDFLRHFKSIHLESNGHTAELQVSPDYFSIGSDTDFFRVPMTPRTARRLAALFNCSLPTRKIVDAIYQQADLKLEPHPLTQNRESVESFLQHHQFIESQRASHPLGLVVAGIKKDIVLTPRLLEKPGHVAIYGWHKLDATPIQPLTTVHIERYVDYSHGVRLVSRNLLVDGRPAILETVLSDPTLCTLLSDEGPFNTTQMYPDP